MNITCLGDSIRIQYTPRVKELLGEAFEIFAPTENCRYSKYTLRGLYEWRDSMKDSRIVHWNNGLWDTCELFDDGSFSTVEEYTANILRIADQLLKNHEVIIFATTTPVSPLNLRNHNEQISRYNAAVVPKLQERGVIVNDLHSLVATDIDRYIRDDRIHLTDEGIELCAHAVADAIRAAASHLNNASRAQNTEVRDDTGMAVSFENQN